MRGTLVLTGSQAVIAHRVLYHEATVQIGAPGLAGVVQHGPPMTLRSRGKLICTQMLRHPISLTYIRMHAAPLRRFSYLGISKPHEIIPGGLLPIYAIFSSFKLNRATGTAPFPLSLLLPPLPD